ncbi:hypothetical protein GGI35DRAFT_455837 [Trichoderma velutinum]
MPDCRWVSWLLGGWFISALEQSELVICQCDVMITNTWHGMASRQGAKIVKPSAHCRTGRLALQTSLTRCDFPNQAVPEGLPRWLR